MDGVSPYIYQCAQCQTSQPNFRISINIENMYPYADWINLMSYDLHGVWDSSDPVGNQVLAHTNLTEIDQLIWLSTW